MQCLRFDLAVVLCSDYRVAAAGSTKIIVTWLLRRRGHQLCMLAGHQQPTDLCGGVLHMHHTQTSCAAACAWSMTMSLFRCFYFVSDGHTNLFGFFDCGVQSVSHQLLMIHEGAAITANCHMAVHVAVQRCSLVGLLLTAHVMCRAECSSAHHACLLCQLVGLSVGQTAPALQAGAVAHWAQGLR